MFSLSQIYSKIIYYLLKNLKYLKSFKYLKIISNSVKYITQRFLNNSIFKLK